MEVVSIETTENAQHSGSLYLYTDSIVTTEDRDCVYKRAFLIRARTDRVNLAALRETKLELIEINSIFEELEKDISPEVYLEIGLEVLRNIEKIFFGVNDTVEG